jgi:hypothetical protein
MTAPAARIARGIVRRASLISSPIVDPLSMPPNAKAIVDQKMMSLRFMLGTNACAFIGVADPNRLQATIPSAISSNAGIHPAIAPTLLSHFPTFSPTTFIVTAVARPIVETAMKYRLLDDSDCQAGPPMKSAFAAPKYSSPGKYGRFDPQYVQPVIKAANGPNARLLQT